MWRGNMRSHTTKIVQRMDDFHPIPALVTPGNKSRRRRYGTRFRAVKLAAFGRRIAGPLMDTAVTPEGIAAVAGIGRGTLEIGDYGLEEGEGGCPIFKWLTFSVQIEGRYDDSPQLQ